MIANFLPSLGLMNDMEVLLNMVALAIVIITVEYISSTLNNVSIFVYIYTLHSSVRDSSIMLKKYWMMAETVIELIAMFVDETRFDYGKSHYK
ncbi:hypothetical protein LXL04_032492 [Taraxacum kok-saghyz]